MKKLFTIILLLATLPILFTACTDTPAAPNTPEEAVETPAPDTLTELELGPNGFRMIHLTEEARDIALEDFDYLLDIILDNAPSQGIVYRRFGFSLEEFLAFMRELIYDMEPIESFTSLLLGERWDEIPDDPRYIAADYLTSFLFSMSVFDLDGIGHFGPTDLEGYEAMFLANSIVLHDPEAAEFFGDIRMIERTLSYFTPPNTMWLYGVDPAEFDLTTDLSDVGARDEDNITIDLIEPDRIAYLHIASFMNSPAFDSEVLFPFFEEVQDYEHLIIDIRGNGGGWAHYVTDYVVGMLIDEPVDFRYYELLTAGERALIAADYYSLSEETTGRVPIADILEEKNWTYLNEDDLSFLYYAIPWHTHVEPTVDNTPFGGEIWLLVDGLSASASEFFAQLSRYSGFATVVGAPTMGVTGAMTTFVSLPHTGILFRIDIGSQIDAYGRSIEEFGLGPDKTIPPGTDALDIVLQLIDGVEIQTDFDPEAALIGMWTCLDATMPRQWISQLTFYADGRFVDLDGDAGYFYISGNSLVLEFDDFMPLTLSFHFRGDELTLTGAGSAVTLTRQ